ncbi:MAG TPA: ferredoxin family protein [Steroidobacteraceae bacterium]|jgi:NAD-dependent dihydropyrimidine dehydrogenase PreA subunit|nr:ferredoxin family protein [Steroidobacteraceae bacterium]
MTGAMAAKRNDCQQEPGLYRPVIDRNRCEGKADCVEVCPYEVFTVGTLPPQQRTGIRFAGKLKGYVHHWQQAFTPNSEACHACGLCVAACPEKAIRLARV